MPSTPPMPSTPLESAYASPSSAAPRNRLAGETSLYLRQHDANPVDWYPWGPEALERAHREDRPLLVSIGYSACHWCHVMAHESFEDVETAALMNRLFVNIKIDREERPDLDQIYMDTVTGLTGHGGWPLTVFCTPAGAPFYGGTYFPPEPRQGMPSFRQLLLAVEDAWRSRRSELHETSQRILEALRRAPHPSAGADPSASTTAEPGGDTLARCALRLLQRADARHGGFGSAPKFPTPTSLDALLAAADELPPRKAREALDHVLLSCREMARGGVYDQLAGGFHRYSVDDHWGVPHFEKMLYDQGQLLRVYTEAWRRDGARDADLLWPIRETAAYLARELMGREGAFFASQDADSGGHEGTYYVWTPEQVEAVLGAERGAAFCSAYGVSARGNFEGGSTVLFSRAREPREGLAAERSELLAARASRIAPATDEKRIAAWNGLAISGLARAGSLLGEPEMLASARRALDFCLRELREDRERSERRDARGRLLRVWNAGRAQVLAFLDDHACLLEACLDLQRAGAGDDLLPHALALADAIATRFYEPSVRDFFLTPCDGETLVQRPRSDHDGATPHSAGLACLTLLRAAALCGRHDLEAIARAVLATHAGELERAPEAWPTLARAARLSERGLQVAVIVGSAADAATTALAQRARLALGPDDAVLVVAPGAAAPAGVDPSWLAGREARGGRATAYVCHGQSCSLPITAPEELQPFGATMSATPNASPSPEPNSHPTQEEPRA